MEKILKSVGKGERTRPMIRITIETNQKTGIGYQLHLKDDARRREWIAYENTVMG